MTLPLSQDIGLVFHSQGATVDILIPNLMQNMVKYKQWTGQ